MDAGGAPRIKAGASRGARYLGVGRYVFTSQKNAS